MNTNFISIAPQVYTDNKHPLGSQKPTDRIDIGYIVAVQNYTRRVTMGLVNMPVTMTLSIRALPPKAFASVFWPYQCNHVVLPQTGVNSARMSLQTQIFAPALNTPLVHPHHIYAAAAALAVRQTLLLYNITLASNTSHNYEENFAASLTRHKRDALALDLDASNIADQILAADLDVAGPTSVLVFSENIRKYKTDVLERHVAQMAALPANLLDGDAWVAQWLDALTPAFPDSDAWRTKALLWRDMACAKRL